MALEDVTDFVVRVLGRAGLASTPDGIPDLQVDSDAVAIVEQRLGPWDPNASHWLEYGERTDGACLCWLAGRPQGELQTPPGWTSSRSLVKLDGVEEGRPVSSLEALPPPAPGHVRLFQGKAYPSRRNN